MPHLRNFHGQIAFIVRIDAGLNRHDLGHIETHRFERFYFRGIIRQQSQLLDSLPFVKEKLSKVYDGVLKKNQELNYNIDDMNAETYAMP